MNSTLIFLNRWGEFTPNLEDVFVRYKIPFLGKDDLACLTLLSFYANVVIHLRKCLTLCNQVEYSMEEEKGD